MKVFKLFIYFSIYTLCFFPTSNAFSQNPFEICGVLHNEICKYQLENIGTIPEDGQLSQKLYDITNQKYQMHDFEDYKQVEDFRGGSDLLSQFDNYSISPALRLETEKLIALTESNLSLSVFLEEVMSNEAAAPEFLSGRDLDVYYASSAVLRHSALFWSSEAEGGMNGIQFLNTPNRGGNLDGYEPDNNRGGPNPDYAFTPTVVIKWWKVILSDWSGAVINGLGGMALGGPPGAAVGFAAGAATASTGAVISELP